ncbi:MAG: hypothetical protein IH851_12580, partial [Armatimonadetes bacterium]|nr:hypothetical protein [Armatimonadota bacterium]
MSNSSSVSEAASRRALALVRSVARCEAPVPVLITGTEGAGQTEVAETLAAALLCLNPDDGTACNDCVACRARESGMSADFLHLQPIGLSDLIRGWRITPSMKPPSKEEEKQVKAPPILEFLRVGPLQARNKVVLIERADRMKQEAANALLKTLEEPPKNVVFILATTGRGKV